MTCTNFNFDGDSEITEEELVNKVSQHVPELLGVPLDKVVMTTQQFDDKNGRFVYFFANGVIVGATFHKTESHTAVVVGGDPNPTARAEAPAGAWAVAVTKCGEAAHAFYDW